MMRSFLARSFWVAFFTMVASIFSTPSAYAVCDAPDVLIVLDKSGSMGGNGKWSSAVNAIRRITNSYKGKLRFGLETFDNGARIVYGINYCIKDGVSGRCVSNLQSALRRIGPGGGTNLIGAINTARSHLNSIRNSDHVKARKRSVMFLTDGQASCAQSQVSSLRSSLGVKTYVIGFGSGVDSGCLRRMAQSGGTGNYYRADSSSSLNAAMRAIADASSREVCNNLDDDCDGLVDEGLTQSCTGQCGRGVRRCSHGRWGACSARNPRPETCNNVDDDCDGRIDEGLTRTCRTACGTGRETCVRGRWVGCTAKRPQPERCDGRDNDCDGRVDENWPQKGRTCYVGIGACRNAGVYVCNNSGSGVTCRGTPKPPQPEICDGIDNDCDGRVDENWPNKGRSCSAGTGACKQTGRYICKPDHSGVQCSVSGGAPTPEVCDGKDNDCNGKIDENLVRKCSTQCGDGIETCVQGRWQGCTARKPEPEKCDNIDNDCDGQVDNNLKRKCSTICGDGQETCINGKWDLCDAPKPQKEVCDGKDNDCDGQVDEVKPKTCYGACGKGQAVCQNGKWSGCSGPQPKPEVCDGKDNDCDGKIDDGLERSCRNQCGSGKQICDNGQWTACTAPIPQPEICDGKDNDCDGIADNNATCPQGLSCHNGRCLAPCHNGECAKGLKCVNGFCEGDLCKSVTCPKGQKCVGGSCYKPCDLIKCDSGYVCMAGQCVKNDCYLRGCPDGKRCVYGFCQSDPCKDKKCDANQFCRDGKCINSCANVKCASNQKCVDGQCVDDPHKSGPCAGVSCAKGEECQNGQCVASSCANITCPKGRHCVEGRCVYDPCINIKCPAGQSCEDGQCIGKSSSGGQQGEGDSQAEGAQSGEEGHPAPLTERIDVLDGGSVKLPDGRIIPPDRVSHLPDGRIVLPDDAYQPNPSQGNPDTDTTALADKEVGQQSQNDTGDSQGSRSRYAREGCSCQTHSKAPLLPMSLSFFLLLLFFFRRRSPKR